MAVIICLLLLIQGDDVMKVMEVVITPTYTAKLVIIKSATDTQLRAIDFSGFKDSSIRLTDTLVTNKGLQVLSGTPFKTLFIQRSNGITVDGVVEVITQMPALGSLSLRDVKGDLGKLEDMSKLTSLDLIGRAYTDADCDRIAKLTQLKKLSISGTAITSKGYWKLWKALPNTQIETSIKGLEKAP